MNINEAAEKYAEELIKSKSLQPHEKTWFYHCLIVFAEQFKAEQKPSTLSDEAKQSYLIGFDKGFKAALKTNVFFSGEEIEKLAEYEGKWEASSVKCDLCSHEWVAVRPEDLIKLECPNCGNMVTFGNIEP